MMKFCNRAALALSLAVGGLAMGVPYAGSDAYASSVNSHAGFQRCKTFKRSGSSYWQGKIRGDQENASLYGVKKFTLIDCFSSEAKCKNFLATGTKGDPNVVVKYSRCTSKS